MIITHMDLKSGPRLAALLHKRGLPSGIATFTLAVLVYDTYMSWLSNLQINRISFGLFEHRAECFRSVGHSRSTA